MPIRDYDLASLTPKAAGSALGKRTNKRIPEVSPLLDSEALDLFLAEKALSDSNTIRPAMELVSPLETNRQFAGEVAFILRPLLYSMSFCTNL